MSNAKIVGIVAAGTLAFITMFGLVIEWLWPS